MMMRQLLQAVRWLLVLPGAVCGGYLAFQIIQLLQTLSVYVAGVSPGSSGVRLAVTTLSAFFFGVGFVFAGRCIAPLRKNLAAYMLAVVATSVIVYLVMPVLQKRDYWAIWNAFSAFLGVGAAIAWVLKTDK